MTPSPSTASSDARTPLGNPSGFVRYFKQDVISGFLVFLIALPLCLGISLACGYPAIAGVFTAIVGSLVTSLISNSELTIKGPAAGLIVIAVGCVNDFGGDGALGGFSEVDISAYRAALAVGVVAAGLQVVFGLLRAGILGDFFPLSAVHGMLAAIGVIIVLKQFPVTLGVPAAGEPLEILRELPHIVSQANPAIAAIGISSLLVMFLWPVLQRRTRALRSIPAPVVALLVAVPMSMGFDLLHPHSFTLRGHEYQLSDQYLVSMPDRVFGMFDEVTLPDFSALAQPRAWKWVFMFFMIGSLESLLSAKAIDMLDPWKRKTNLDRDMLGVGVANLLAAMVGGLPMISEIVRSKANIDNGARTRFADMWHGVFLLLCVALIPTVLHRIPLAALAAMLVYTGYRLAHPKEFVNVYRIGREQLVIFVVTLVGVLATDLLIGIALGILAKIVIHMLNGARMRSLLKPLLEVEPDGSGKCVLRVRESAIFSNWIPLRRQLENVGLARHQNVTVDLSQAVLVDHSVMEKLHNMQEDFEQAGLELSLVGLETHHSSSDHELAARKRVESLRMRRVTVLAPAAEEAGVSAALSEAGLTGVTVFPGRWADVPGRGPCQRFEFLVPTAESAGRIRGLREALGGRADVVIYIEAVDVVQREAGAGSPDPAPVGAP